ncbi:transcriptional regulator, AlpA family [Thermoactinomyces sp. DSM 45891]|uniref:helix-turn-helix transcriptional regulator n=1 Tax=Thermoactinomyces sp. DSM 45891 TaxID=1761907 RepID=UPI000919617A|nr:helix-turn-helix domain-containing protein [Thermoactinomyces sp. DSM 45891]SFX65913.1 transcriptional regulator, AlpA family [Thermoactinomyces sp. DSM 45891]
MNTTNHMNQLFQEVAELNAKVLDLKQQPIQQKQETQRESIKTYNAKEVAKILGISRSMTYELLRNPNFPVLHIGKRKVVPKHKLEQWIDQQAQ